MLGGIIKEHENEECKSPATQKHVKERPGRKLKDRIVDTLLDELVQGRVAPLLPFLPL